MQEIWKDIKDYEGLYQVSNLGRVKSLKKTIIRNNNYKQTFTNANGKHIRAISYVADFYYYDNKLGCYVVEDVKASKTYKTEVYKLKKKMFEYKYNAIIKKL